MIKVLQQETGVLDGKIGKIHAEALNQKNVSGLLDKVSGGCLIIEQAGDMEKKTVSELSNLLDADESGLFVIWKIHPRASSGYSHRMRHLHRNSVSRFPFRFLLTTNWLRLHVLIPGNLDTKLMIWRFWHCITGSAIFRDWIRRQP